jgi:tRNA G10  N-methylase Trm11
LRQNLKFDAIVCDPPYGIKARSTKTGATDGKYPKPQPHELEQYEPYYSQKLNYDFVELHDRLLSVAADLLIEGGYLVFLFHTDEQDIA